MNIYTDKFAEIRKQPEYADPFDELVDFPLMVDIELKRGKGEYMRPPVFFKALNQIKELGAKGIRFERGGDPLGHRNVMWFIRAARRENLLVSLQTRGRLLYLGIDSLCNSGLNTFILHLGNISEDNYRGKLRDLTIMKRRRKFGPFIKVIANPHTISSAQMQDEFKEGCDVFDYIQGGTTDRCPEPWRHLAICWNGDAILCPSDYVGISKVDNIDNADLHALWHSDKAKKMRVEGFKSLCRDCELWRLESE